MKKRLLALLLAGAMSVGLAACGNSGDEGSANTPAGGETTPVTDGTGEPSAEGKTVKVGMVCIGDENDQGYTYNFMKAVEEATAQLAEQGITVEWSYKKNILEDSGCEDANIELAEDGCDIIINNSYGFEPFMLKVAPDYPEIEFISCTNQASAVDDLDNTHNAFANIYEGRYLAGVAGGMKLQQMIDEGTITAEEAVIGYVAAFPFAEVVSGYTAFYQGAQSACPSVTMKVKYVNSWSDAPQEAAAASALAGRLTDCQVLTYLPEVPVDEDKMLADIEKAYAKGKGLLVTVSEGIRGLDGKPLADTGIVDGFGHTVPGGTAQHVTDQIIQKLGLKSRAEKPGLLGRASIPYVSQVDREEAYAVGKFAVESALNGESGHMVAIDAVRKPAYSSSLSLVPLDKVANVEKKFPLEWIVDGNQIADGFFDYAMPLMGGDFPEYALLR